MIQIKPGAKVNGIQPEMIIALMVANDVYSKYDTPCGITEGTGGKHGTGSLHYVGLAIDIRTRNIVGGKEEFIAQQIRVNLGEQYDVVLESDHIHIEFQPK